MNIDVDRNAWAIPWGTTCPEGLCDRSLKKQLLGDSEKIFQRDLGLVGLSRLGIVGEEGPLCPSKVSNRFLISTSPLQYVNVQAYVVASLNDTCYLSSSKARGMCRLTASLPEAWSFARLRQRLDSMFPFGSKLIAQLLTRSVQDSQAYLQSFCVSLLKGEAFNYLGVYGRPACGFVPGETSGSTLFR